MDKRRREDLMERAERLCRARGARLTSQRRRVLQLVCNAGRPLGAYEILDLMRSQAKTPAPPAVYRALDFLVQQRLVHKLESLHAFIGCIHPESPHSSQFLICADCGEVNELHDDSVARILQSAEQANGFETKRRVVELIGTCAQCAHKTDPSQ